MRELPQGWAETTLGEVAETKLGKMLSAKSKVGANPRPYLRNKNVQWGRIDVDDMLRMDFSDEEFESFRLLPNDLLVCEGGEVGRTAIWRDPTRDIAFQKALHRVRPMSEVQPEFLLYLFRWFGESNAFDRYVTGSTIKHLPQEDLRRLPLPLPPLAEQRRIVAAMEEQFSRLDAANSLLCAAFKRIARLRDGAFEVGARDWPLRRLAELLREPLRNGHSAKGSRDGTGVRTLTLTAVTRDDFSEPNTKLTVAEPDRVGDLWLEPGDVLIERSNTPELVGTAAMYDGPRHWAIFPDLLIRVRTNDELLPAYLEFALRSKRARGYFKDRAQGIAGSMPKIDQRAVEAFQLPVPPLDEQQRIVAELEQQLSLIDSLRAAVESAQKRSAALRRSILERAFRGELVAQDPADESASVLLERIRADRAAAPVARRRPSA